MNSPSTPAVLAVLIFCLGVVHLLHPIPALSRINPMAFFVVAALLGLRYAARRQSGKRAELLKAVPKRPLGLDE